MNNVYKLIVKVAVIVMLAVVSGCATAPPVVGILYTGVISPSGEKVNVTASSAAKAGRASCQSVLILVAWGDCSVEAAMKEGNITRIHHVDQENMHIYTLFSMYTTIVYGE